MRGLDSIGVAYLPSHGNFLLVRVAAAGKGAAPVYESLLRSGVIVRPVANYGLPDWLRVTVGLPEENARFLSALSAALAPIVSCASPGKLVVVGIGLIGGSFALALKDAGKVGSVVGVGRGRDNLDQALRLAIIDRAYTRDEAGRLSSPTPTLVLLATPVGANACAVRCDRAASGTRDGRHATPAAPSRT